MKNKVSSILTRATALALFATPFCPTQLQAQEVYSQIVGAIAIDLPAASDVVVAFPFKRSASFRGPVASSGTNTITISGPVFTDMDLDSGYYVFIESDDDATSGNLAGRRFDITGHDNSTLTVDADIDISGLSGSADIISVREHWTLGEAFPQGIGFVEETQPGLRQVELFMPEKASVGGGLSARRILYYYDGHWREVGGDYLNESLDDAIVEPGATFVIRNNGSSALRSYFFGEVVDSPLAIPVVSNGTEVVDNFVGIERPLGIKIEELGLEGIMGAGDKLLVYGSGSKNPVPTEYEYTTQWQEVDTSIDAGGVVIGASQGIAIHKAINSSSALWVNEWSLPGGGN